MVTKERLFQKLESLNEEYLRFWEQVCNTESKTSEKAGVDAVGALFCNRATVYGWKIDRQKQEVSGDCICITMNENAPAKPIIFSAHSDTVHPHGSFGSPAAHSDEEKIYGPGASDCKGGLVAGLLAMAALEECDFRDRPIKLIIQSDEETSSIGSNKTTVDYMVEQSRGCAAFLNCEPAMKDHKVCVRRKGIVRFRLEITGKAVHSSLCPQGQNAICEAAHKIIELERYKDIEGMTCSCNMIEGGVAFNSVPEHCSLIADVRVKSMEQMREAREIVRQVAEHSYIEGTTCVVTEVSSRPPMELLQRNLDLLDDVNNIFAECGLDTLSPGFSKGGSDAAYIAAAGIPCLDNLGILGGEEHSVREFAYLSSLVQTAKQLAVIANFYQDKTN